MRGRAKGPKRLNADERGPRYCPGPLVVAVFAAGKRCGNAPPPGTYRQMDLAGLPSQTSFASTVSPFIRKESAARMTLSPMVTP